MAAGKLNLLVFVFKWIAENVLTGLSSEVWTPVEPCLITCFEKSFLFSVSHTWSPTCRRTGSACNAWFTLRQCKQGSAATLETFFLFFLPPAFEEDWVWSEVIFVFAPSAGGNLIKYGHAVCTKHRRENKILQKAGNTSNLISRPRDDHHALC